MSHHPPKFEEHNREAKAGTQEQKNNKNSLPSIDERFQIAIENIQQQFNIYDTSKDKGLNGVDDILRSQIFFLDSALDLYVSDIVRFGFRQFLNHICWDIAEDGRNITVKISVLKECVSCSNSEDIKDKLMGEFNYSIRTSMKYDAIINNLIFVGIKLPDKWTNEKSEDYRKLKKDINNLSDRRNKIGHNSDYDDKREKITIKKEKVIYYIEQVKKLQKIIHTTVESMNEKTKKKDNKEEV